MPEHAEHPTANALPDLALRPPESFTEKRALSAFGKWHRANPNRSFHDYIFRNHAGHNRRLAQALEQTGAHYEIVQRVTDCCKNVGVYRHNETGTLKTIVWRCRNRFCAACASLTARPMRRRAQAWALSAKHMSLVTLTRAHTADQDLHADLTATRRAWDKLRKNTFWKACVHGGLRAIELAPSKSYKGAYHVHMHILVASRYMPGPLLDHAWSAAQPDHRDASAHIQSITAHSPKANPPDEQQQLIARFNAIRYVTKYVTKPLPDPIYSSPARLAHVITAIGRARLASLFGKWLKPPPNKLSPQHFNDPSDCDRPVACPTLPNPIHQPRLWTYLGSLDQIIQNARSDLAALAFDASVLHALNYGPPPPPPPPTFQDLPKKSRAPPPTLFNLRGAA